MNRCVLIVIFRDCFDHPIESSHWWLIVIGHGFDHRFDNYYHADGRYPGHGSYPNTDEMIGSSKSVGDDGYKQSRMYSDMVCTTVVHNARGVCNIPNNKGDRIAILDSSKNKRWVSKDSTRLVDNSSSRESSIHHNKDYIHTAPKARSIH